MDARSEARTEERARAINQRIIAEADASSSAERLLATTTEAFTTFNVAQIQGDHESRLQLESEISEAFKAFNEAKNEAKRPINFSAHEGFSDAMDAVEKNQRGIRAHSGLSVAITQAFTTFSEAQPQSLEALLVKEGYTPTASSYTSRVYTFLEDCCKYMLKEDVGILFGGIRAIFEELTESLCHLEEAPGHNPDHFLSQFKSKCDEAIPFYSFLQEHIKLWDDQELLETTLQEISTLRNTTLEKIVEAAPYDATAEISLVTNFLDAIKGIVENASVSLRSSQLPDRYGMISFFEEEKEDQAQAEITGPSFRT